MDYRSLGRQIRIARRERGMTQKQLSELSGISLSFLGHIERGTRKASLETVAAIARTLTASVDWLLADALRPPAPEDGLLEIVLRIEGEIRKAHKLLCKGCAKNAK